MKCLFFVAICFALPCFGESLEFSFNCSTTDVQGKRKIVRGVKGDAYFSIFSDGYLEHDLQRKRYEIDSIEKNGEAVILISHWQETTNVTLHFYDHKREGARLMIDGHAKQKTRLLACGKGPEVKSPSLGQGQQNSMFNWFGSHEWRGYPVLGIYLD